VHVPNVPVLGSSQKLVAVGVTELVTILVLLTSAASVLIAVVLVGVN
jgi:hypothetical protein